MTRRFILNRRGDRLAVEDDGTTITPYMHVASMPAITVDPPVGGATSAKQDTGNSSIASVDGKLPALVGGRIPVVLPAGAGGLTDTELRATAVPVSGTFYPATQPVSGTFWQSVQPVSGTVAVSNLPASQAVTGTFWQATQPVSGPLTNTELRAVAVPVSGTFWQGTQPVSIAATVPVSGTFWQATQPVSLAASVAITAVALPLPAGASTEATLALIKAKTDNIDVALSTRAVTGLTDAQLRATALPVSGTFFQATQPVSIASTVAISAAALPLPSGATTAAKQDTIIAALPASLGQKTMAASLAVALASDQGTVPVQVKDSGRVRCTFSYMAVASATGDTLLSLSKNLGGTVTTATSFGVTAGKRLRITGVIFSVKSGAAAAAFATLTLRSNASGATVLTSPVITRVDIGNTAATIGAADWAAFDVPDGFEFSGAETIGASLAAQAITNIISVTFVGYEYTP